MPWSSGPQTTRSTKKSDTRSKGFTGRSVELDAIPAHLLRELANDSIEQHVDEQRLAVLLAVEEEERRGLLKLVEGMAL